MLQRYQRRRVRTLSLRRSNKLKPPTRLHILMYTKQVQSRRLTIWLVSENILQNSALKPGTVKEDNMACGTAGTHDRNGDPQAGFDVTDGRCTSDNQTYGFSKGPALER